MVSYSGSTNNSDLIYDVAEDQMEVIEGQLKALLQELSPHLSEWVVEKEHNRIILRTGRPQESDIARDAFPSNPEVYVEIPVEIRKTEETQEPGLPPDSRTWTWEQLGSLLGNMSTHKFQTAKLITINEYVDQTSLEKI